jgi:transcriptional regulator with XRE-family HTH domain
VNVGQNVKRIREEQRYTQTEIARWCGVTPAAISGLEHGGFTPSTPLLVKLARALDVSVEELVEGPVLLGKAKAPQAGPSLLDKALGAARRDAQLDAQAIARLFASEGKQQDVTSYEEDKFRAELRTLGFPDEHFEDFVWPLVKLAAKTEQLEEQLEDATPENVITFDQEAVREVLQKEQAGEIDRLTARKYIADLARGGSADPLEDTIGFFMELAEQERTRAREGAETT